MDGVFKAQILVSENFVRYSCTCLGKTLVKLLVKAHVYFKIYTKQQQNALKVLHLDVPLKKTY